MLAARRHGVRTIILPRQNDKSVREDIGEELRRDMTIHLVSTIDEVLALALTPVKEHPVSADDTHAAADIVVETVTP